MTEQQQQLFISPDAPWDEDDAQERLVAAVVFPTGPPQRFDYVVPDALAAEVEVGRRLRVPFGRGDRQQVGYCVEVGPKRSTGRRLKSIGSVVDRRALLSPGMLRLAQWLAEYYLASLGQVFDTVLPAGVRDGAGTRAAVFLALAPGVKAQLADLELSKKQRAVLEVLADADDPMPPQEVATAAGCTFAPITALRKRGLIVRQSKRVHRPPELRAKPARADDLQLNRQQQQALDAIFGALRAREHEVLLLHGVTGSGKTEVYIRAIQEVVSYGRQAIVLVPEISLTPQTVDRFSRRFDSVAVLHSHLTDAERHWHWEQIASGDVQVVVGARSAIFAPTPHLGLIVLDEEHEPSFKQETTPRYHARDVALWRARDEGIPLLLGSATPSLETWHQAQTGEYRLLELPQRVLDLPMPRVMTIDLANERQARGTRWAISRPLGRAMEKALGDGGQVILFLNRRGYSTHIQCPSCAAVLRCPQCDIPLTHHRQDDSALCHYCDYHVPAPDECPECGFAGIRYSGLGTERLEAEVRTRFPNYKALRMDTDAMRGAGAHERALAAFREGEVQILLGTQMIAKGLDFPNVTLVGVVNADTAIHLPDFRAAERAFQLLSQVAGRTGRGAKGGHVLVQTLNPHHPSIDAAVRHDYEGFAKVELDVRRDLGYPPFGRLIRVLFRGPLEDVTRDFADTAAGRLRAVAVAGEPEVRILGPAPAPIAKLRGEVRFHLLLQGLQSDRLREVLRIGMAGLDPPTDVQWTTDVDPLNML
ncbi:MAG: primosomal protein N' [Pirellulales bacterium]